MLAEQGIERAEGQAQDEDIETDEELLVRHRENLFDVFKDSIQQFAAKNGAKKVSKATLNNRKDQVRNFANESLFTGQIANADLEY